MRSLSGLVKASLIAFCSSFCVMVIELLAARILAPYIGVSLYTWTSIIGVILAGIALGNYSGGKLADKFASPLVLVAVLLAGALATMAILPLSVTVTAVSWLSSLHLMLNSTLKVLCIFFLPAIILSMVSPLVIKLALVDLGKTGGVVGTIYACSTVGAILGTFMTGFYFILWFGSMTTVWLVVIVLMLSALLAWFFWRMPGRWPVSSQNIMVSTMVLMILLSAFMLFTFRGYWQDKYTRESNYYFIQVTTSNDTGGDSAKNGVMKVLALDHLIHSYVLMDDPTFFRHEYLKVFKGIVRYVTGENRTPAVLHLGGGGYSFPRYMEVVYPGSINDVIEIDPAVTQVAYEELGLPRETHITTFNEDARLFLAHRALKAKYDIVIGDVFNDMTTPYHLTTLEFDKLVKNSLKPDGIYLVNIIDRYYGGNYMPAFINTLKHAFKYVYLFYGSYNLESADGGTFVIAATDRRINIDDFLAFIAKTGEDAGIIHALDETKLEEYLASRHPLLLTDDYAPTDVLIAPVFRARAERK